MANKLNYSGSISTKASALKFADSARAHNDYQTAFQGIILTTDGHVAGSDGFHLTKSRNAFTVSDDWPVAVQTFREGALGVVIKPAAKSLPSVTASQRSKAMARIDFDSGLIYWPGDKVIPFTVMDAIVPDINRVIPSKNDKLTSHAIPLNIIKAANALKHWPGDIETAMNLHSGWYGSSHHGPTETARFMIDDGTHIYMLANLMDREGSPRFFALPEAHR